MQNTEQTNTGLLDYFQVIVETSKKHGLSDDFFREAESPLNKISEVLGISHLQTALFALLLEHSGGTSVELEDIARALQCGSIQLMKYVDEFEALEKKKLVRAVSGTMDSLFSPRGSRSQRMFLPSFIVPVGVIQAIRKGTAYECNDYCDLAPEDFFMEANDLFAAIDADQMSLKAAFNEFAELFAANPEIQFVKALSSRELNHSETFVLTFFCCALVENNKDTIALNEFRDYIGSKNLMRLRREFNNREHKLIKLGLVKNSHDHGIADTEQYQLSDKAKNEFLGDVSLKRKKRHKGKEFIPAKSINRKELFYSDKAKGRIDELTSLLFEKNFKKIKSRLAQRKMRTGFTCLFSGPPGTGKTETVYQIARLTGRDIFLVDISETKSMWFGESEKIIKGLFERYQGLIKQKGRTPILLFNEADAIMGKRQELGDVRRGPAQTENAIQNIILQEMENLAGGILIATTNMTCNLDNAFERRFLYKIEFEKPSERIKASIWRSLMPGLSDNDASALSRRFDFSGGQIENIARKEAVSSILRGNELPLEDIITLCDEEESGKKTIQIGFTSAKT